MMPARPRAPKAPSACLLLFTKPARPGRVKTRLIGALSAERAAELHDAFLGDLCERLAGADRFELRLAWALDEGEEAPPSSLPSVRQRGDDLGERLFSALADAAVEHELVGAVGSDHPELSAERVDAAFAALASGAKPGADVVVGPATDGGYYLIAVRGGALDRRLFEDVPWSTGAVLERTLARCAELGLTTDLLPPESDVDTPADLVRLAEALRDPSTPACPRTAALLARWGVETLGTNADLEAVP
jgi:uncharacterized protein